ncbi:AraC family transcriptional regulator [Helicobacter cholecystus]|uniref:AraC family transcriptional regulator n=1 Tax=Helicobacter cholecystus TaxID=45498 RepID=A0A3D8IYF0_9HELI|nr:AraC family transcriptional regulator [Helicobacter cholecystus]RDU69581.1 AraC family transcriptional regulator [Helicobacter cholecystus]VEJ24138.1 HTH-type transcriptional regulator gadX [Helicobacter cholecystus]
MSLIVPQELYSHKIFTSPSMTMIDFVQKGNIFNRSVYFQKDCLIFVKEGEKEMRDLHQSFQVKKYQALFVSMGSYAFSNISRNNLYHSVLFFFNKNPLVQFAQKHCMTKNRDTGNFCLFRESERIENFVRGIELWGELGEEIMELKAQELLLLLLKENKVGFLPFLYKIFNRKNTLIEDLEVKDFLQVKDMAREVKLETSIFSKKFKEESGISPKEWIDKKRLSKARFMLQFEGKNIQEVAYELDFGSPSWFIKRFKDYYGMTPKQFQKISKN